MPGHSAAITHVQLNDPNSSLKHENMSTFVVEDYVTSGAARIPKNAKILGKWNLNRFVQ
jgi:hypothetical protein